ncbi:AAA family ATPase [Vibrio tritonius]|uniref:AAA family ATPase n=1 Tax=Vibrio tritonius TaxID=1435069 RepID=UPI00083945DE|nr:AAA family ATPase [Vibrio tritonius]
MKLEELSIRNFMPYKGEQKVQFPQHETQNVMLLFGDNMRGKTSFLNSIRWGFYGSAIGRHLREIPRVNLVNMDSAAEGDWSMGVTLKFSHAGKQYELKRHIKKKEYISEPKNDSDFEENVGLRVNGEVLTADRIINKINQVIPEEISRFFLFDGELLQEYENLLIEESEQGEKIKEHIEQALGVPALIHGRDELRTLSKKARALQAKDAKKDKELQQYAEQQRQLDIQLTSLEKDQRDLKAQLTEKQNEIDVIDDELKNTEAVQKKKIQLEGLIGEKKVTEQQLANLKDEQRQLLKTAWKDVLSESVSPILDDLKLRRNSIQDALSREVSLKNKISELKATLDNPLCPTCGQHIPEDNMAKIKSSIEQYLAEAELSVTDVENVRDLNSKIDKLSKITSHSECSRIVQIVNKQRQSDIELIRIETKLDEIDEEIREYDTDQIMRQREKREQLIIHVSRIKNDLSKIKQSIDENQKRQDHIATLISKSAGAQGQLSSRRVNLCQELECIFSDGIDLLRDSLRSNVQKYASEAFSELTTEKSYSGLEINRNYGLSIIDHEGRTLKERSAGAEQVVALSLIDGLNRTARNSGAIVMDTPLGRLDPKHRSNVLKYLPKMAEQVVLLVHEGEIDPKKDLSHFAERIGARYQIKRISATESRIERGD